MLHSPAFRRLAGKTQLFPSNENDFFRNRLTHSLEVAQIASAVARKINSTHTYFKKHNINTRLCEMAALAHDIGHPPFGHLGEEALHALMNGSGGFEGNAQTIRIISKLEKKEFLNDSPNDALSIQNGTLIDNRLGLDLCARSMAAVLKYDNLITPTKSPTDDVVKGYYYDDVDVIEFIKSKVGDPGIGVSFKTIECSIMDISDDIAYSTYDLEDAFKGGFLHPLKMVAASTEFKDDVAGIVRKRAQRYYPELSSRWNNFAAADVDAVLLDVFDKVFEVDSDLSDPDPDKPTAALLSASTYVESKLWAEDGYYRTALTSYLVSRFVGGVTVESDTRGENPIFWNARLSFDDFMCVEVLKVYAFKSLIMSSFLRISEYRGKDTVSAIFKALKDGGGPLMMPPDCRRGVENIGSHPVQMRLITDFVSSMTDRYAIEFFKRMVGTDSPTIFKPY